MPRRKLFSLREKNQIVAQNRTKIVNEPLNINKGITTKHVIFQRINLDRGPICV